MNGLEMNNDIHCLATEKKRMLSYVEKQLELGVIKQNKPEIKTLHLYVEALKNIFFCIEE